MLNYKIFFDCNTIRPDVQSKAFQTYVAFESMPSQVPLRKYWHVSWIIIKQTWVCYLPGIATTCSTSSHYL